MKKTASILVVALAAAFAAPAFASFSTTAGAKQSDSQQLLAKKGGSKGHKAKAPKSAKA